MRRRDPRLVDVDADRDAVVHGDGERLRAAHAAEPGGQRDRPGQRAAELLVGDRREGLEGALQDALRADVDPRAGRHLAVHDQAQLLELAELLPVGPVADQVGVGDQHARRPLVGAHHADRLARLHEQRLVGLEVAQARQQGVVRRPGRARPCRCRRRRRGPRGARRPRGRGCSSASAAAPRSARTSPTASVPCGRVDGRAPWSAVPSTVELVETISGLRSLSSTADRTAPDETSSTAVSISGDRKRSGPGAPTPCSRSRRRRRRWPARASCPRSARGPEVERRGRRSAARSRRTRVSPSTERRSLRAADQPIDTWSSCIALDGIESTLAGTASRLSSETIAAWVYCAIIRPLSTPGSSARNGGRPWLRARSRKRSVRRSAMRRRRRRRSRGSRARRRPGRRGSCRWTRPGPSSGVSTTGLSTAAASSRPATVAACSTVSRAAPCTCGRAAQRVGVLDAVEVGPRGGWP